MVVDVRAFEAACNDLGVAVHDEVTEEGRAFLLQRGRLEVAQLADDALLVLGQQLSLRSGHAIDVWVAEAHDGFGSVFRAKCNGPTHTDFDLVTSTHASELECGPDAVLDLLIDGCVPDGSLDVSPRRGSIVLASELQVRPSVEPVEPSETPPVRFELLDGARIRFYSDSIDVAGRYELRLGEDADFQSRRTLFVFVDVPAVNLVDALKACWTALGVGRFDRIRTKRSAISVVLPLPVERVAETLLDRLIEQSLIDLKGPRDLLQNALSAWIAANRANAGIGARLGSWLLERDDIEDVYATDDDLSAALTMSEWTVEQSIARHLDVI